MFRCEDCEAIFDEPAVERELIGEYWGTPAYENFVCCPKCGSDFIEGVEDDE